MRGGEAFYLNGMVAVVGESERWWCGFPCGVSSEELIDDKSFPGPSAFTGGGLSLYTPRM